MTLLIDTLAYTNHLRSLPPSQKLLFALTILAIALIAHPITQLLVILWMSVWIVVYARIPLKIYLRLLTLTGVFLGTSLLALIVNFVSIQKLSLVQVDSLGGIGLGNWYGYLSKLGIQQSLTIAPRALSCTSCLLFVLLTIPFSEGLQVLRKWNVPTLLTDLLLLMYRFVFLFLKTATELGLAQRARGGYRDRRRWLHSLGLLVGQLVARSLQRYRQFSLGLTARGFSGELQVYSGRKFTYSRRYARESWLGCVGLIFIELLYRF
jgi:cobalt/nickel transport system permease protein